MKEISRREFIKCTGLAGAGVVLGLPVLNELNLLENKERGYGISVPIFVYHAVDSKPLPGLWGEILTVPTEQFQNQMSNLTKNSNNTVTLTQIHNAMETRTSLPPRPVAITFDDGYLDQYKVAFPILKAHNLTATFFVITGIVGNPGYIDWGGLREMQDNGMAIESHTVHHPNLTKISSVELATELIQSKEAIRDHLGKDSQVLAYPEGKYNKQVEKAARDAGYSVALSCDSGKTLYESENYKWPRIKINSGKSLFGFIKGVI